jgi:hypothetical protein
VPVAFEHGGLPSPGGVLDRRPGPLPAARDPGSPLSRKLLWPPRPKPGLGAATLASERFPRSRSRLLALAIGAAALGSAVVWRAEGSALLAAGAAVLAPILGLALLSGALLTYVEYRPALRRAARRIDAEALAEWQGKMDIWYRAFYCQRDDWLFVPAVPSHPGAPADALMALLTDPALREAVDAV